MVVEVIYITHNKPHLTSMVEGVNVVAMRIIIHLSSQDTVVQSTTQLTFQTIVSV